MGIKETIKNKIRDMATFGFNLPYSSESIEQAENIIGKPKGQMTDEEYKKFIEILDDMKEKGQQSDGDLSRGKNGGAVMKMKSGGMATKRNKPASRSNKPRVAGRLATRGYGKAFKGK